MFPELEKQYTEFNQGLGGGEQGGGDDQETTYHEAETSFFRHFDQLFDTWKELQVDANTGPMVDATGRQTGLHTPEDFKEFKARDELVQYTGDFLRKSDLKGGGNVSLTSKNRA